MSRKGRPKGDSERAAARRVVSLRLRQEGLSFRQIAQRLGISGKTAFQDVDVALAEVATLEHDEAKRLRALELGRLDALLQSLWAKAKRGTYEAVDRVLKILDKRAELLGLTGARRMTPWGPELPGPGEVQSPETVAATSAPASVSVTVINQTTSVQIGEVLALAKEHGLLERLLGLPEVANSRFGSEGEHDGNGHGNGNGAGDGPQRLDA